MVFSFTVWHTSSRLFLNTLLLVTFGKPYWQCEIVNRIIEWFHLEGTPKDHLGTEKTCCLHAAWQTSLIFTVPLIQTEKSLSLSLCTGYTIPLIYLPLLPFPLLLHPFWDRGTRAACGISTRVPLMPGLMWLFYAFSLPFSPFLVYQFLKVLCTCFHSVLFSTIFAFLRGNRQLRSYHNIYNLAFHIFAIYVTSHVLVWTSLLQDIWVS